MQNVLYFTLDRETYAIDLAFVEKVLWVMEVSPIPNAPECILGLLTYHDRILPVYDTRRVLHLPAKELELSDRFLLCKKGGESIALLVDHVEGVGELSAESSRQPIQSLLETTRGLVNFCDLAQILPDVSHQGGGRWGC